MRHADYAAMLPLHRFEQRAAVAADYDTPIPDVIFTDFRHVTPEEGTYQRIYILPLLPLSSYIEKDVTNEPTPYRHALAYIDNI